jgi:hypothetical protein
MLIFSLIKRTLKVRDKRPEKIKIILPLPLAQVLFIWQWRQHQRQLTLLWIIPSSSSNEYLSTTVFVTLSSQHRSERQFLWIWFILLFSRLFRENVSRLSCSTPQSIPSNSFQFCRKQIIYSLTLRDLRNSKSSLYEPRINNDFSIMSLHKRWPIFVFLLVYLYYDASQLCRLRAVKGLMQWTFLVVYLLLIFMNCVFIQV